MTTLNIKFDANEANERFPIYRHYKGQSFPQPAYLELDIRDGSLDADYSAEIGNAVPGAVWHKLILRFTLMPETRAPEIEKIIEENRDTFQAILDGSETVWDGNNMVGKFTDKADELITMLEQSGQLSRDVSGGMLILENQFDNTSMFPADNQSLEDFAQEVMDWDGEGGFYFPSEYLDTDLMLSDLRYIWADALYSGKELPRVVAEHLLLHGTCDDSAWLEELSAMAAGTYSED